jgi:hypothetical protein
VRAPSARRRHHQARHRRLGPYAATLRRRRRQHDLSAGLSAGAQGLACRRLRGARHHLSAAQRARPPGLRLLAGAAGADDGQHRAAPAALAARLFLRRLDPERADRRAGGLDAGPDPPVPGPLPNPPPQAGEGRVGAFAGDLAKRRRAKFVPGESAVKVHQTKEPEHKQDFDEWLARIICYAFSVPPQWAVKLINRATADNQSAQAEDEGLEPTKEWVKDLVDEVIAEEFASPDLELMWLDEDSGAAEIEAQFEARVKIGAATLNELRDALGLDPFQNPAADRPMVLTPTGYVPIEAGGGGGPSSSPSDGGRAANALSTPTVQKYNPEQPRVPAGQSGGGQWTKEGEGGPSSNLSASPQRTEVTSDSGPSYAIPVNDSRVISDVTPDNTWKPGAQYAQDEVRPGVGLSATLRALVEEGRITEEEAAAAQQRSNAYADALKARIEAAIETRTVGEAKSVLSSQELAQLRAAYEAGQETTVTIGGRTIQYEPNMPPNIAAMTDYKNNGFTMGPGAFETPQETQATVLHELYRLNTTEAGAAGVYSGESTAAETDAAQAFVKKTMKSGVMDQ